VLFQSGSEAGEQSGRKSVRRGLEFYGIMVTSEGHSSKGISSDHIWSPQEIRRRYAKGLLVRRLVRAGGSGSVGRK
jgi:hypothetical protein